VIERYPEEEDMRDGEEQLAIAKDAILHRALSLGVNFLDIADMYGVGKNEELAGRAIRDRRATR